MIVTSVHDGITVVALNRPERHNTLVPELTQQLVDELRAAGDSGRPVVLTATGPTFCAGADLGWLAQAADPTVAVADLVACHHLSITTMLDMPVPVIACINGAVAGAGLALALAADYRVAVERATFTAAYLPLGLTPEGGLSAFLLQIIGRARALELLLTNTRLSATQARDWGMVHEVTADGDGLARAITFAQNLDAAPGYALRLTRGLLDTINIRNQLQLEAVAIRTTARGAWFREALQAFLRAHPDEIVSSSQPSPIL